MKNNPAFFFIVLCSCAVLGLCISATGAAVPDGEGQPNAPVTTAELNVTNISLANVTIPDKYPGDTGPNMDRDQHERHRRRWPEG